MDGDDGAFPHATILARPTACYTGRITGKPEVKKQLTSDDGDPFFSPRMDLAVARL
jgi:hypothetical protein